MPRSTHGHERSRRKVPITSEICQQCARCCQCFHMLIGDPNDALRFSRLKTKQIEVRELVPGKIWKVLFHTPCKELRKRKGKYVCAIYEDGFCASYRDAYPDNFLARGVPREVLEDEMKTCPALRDYVMSHRAARQHSRARKIR